MDQRRVGTTPTAFVFAPAPKLTVTIEAAGPEAEDDEGELHLHAGGQGFWIANLMTEQGLHVSMVSSFAGEVGQVERNLIGATQISLVAIEAGGTNSAYVHDRRSGERQLIAQTRPTPLTRHELDDLYTAALTQGLEADVSVLGGPDLHPPVPAEVYRRLATDLRANGARVVADLSGETLDEALAGGLSVLKVSAEDLQRDGLIPSDDPATIAASIRDLAARGAERVVVTRSDKGALAFGDGQVLEVLPPVLDAVEHRGAGDSFTAGLASSLARGTPFVDALRVAAAAGALNTTRRGLGTGGREEIEHLAGRVEVRPWTGEEAMRPCAS
jgi:1-phosphofructokinase